jgi:hypothetical protein
MAGYIAWDIGGLIRIRFGSSGAANPFEARCPPYGRVEGKYLVNFQGILRHSGNIQRGVHFWEVPFVLMLSPGGRTER